MASIKRNWFLFRAITHGCAFIAARTLENAAQALRHIPCGGQVLIYQFPTELEINGSFGHYLIESAKMLITWLIWSLWPVLANLVTQEQLVYKKAFRYFTMHSTSLFQLWTTWTFTRTFFRSSDNQNRYVVYVLWTIFISIVCKTNRGSNLTFLWDHPKYFTNIFIYFIFIYFDRLVFCD